MIWPASSSAPVVQLCCDRDAKTLAVVKILSCWRNENLLERLVVLRVLAESSCGSSCLTLSLSKAQGTLQNVAVLRCGLDHDEIPTRRVPPSYPRHTCRVTAMWLPSLLRKSKNCSVWSSANILCSACTRQEEMPVVAEQTGNDGLFLSLHPRHSFSFPKLCDHSQLYFLLRSSSSALPHQNARLQSLALDRRRKGPLTRRTVTGITPPRQFYILIHQEMYYHICGIQFLAQSPTSRPFTNTNHAVAGGGNCLKRTPY